MTTHYTKRCKHCRTVYAYQGSGEGCFAKENDKRYCPDCMTAINVALDKIEKKFEFVWKETTEITEKEFYEARKERRDNSSGLCFVRVFPPSYKMDGNKTIDTSHSTTENINGRQYRISKWDNGTEPTVMYVAMEKDCMSGGIKNYWVEYNE